MSAARPWVVVSVTATVDGRVALNRTERLLDPGAAGRWRAPWPRDAEALIARRDAAIERRHRPMVVLEGSGTFVADDAGPAPRPGAPAGDLHEDFVPRMSPRWFAVVDGRGRVPWTYTGDAETALLPLVCRATPPGYLADLREREIPYLVAGDDRVDLATALDRLGEVLGVRCVVSHAGGGLNGALLRAGLVDELHVVTVPALAGGLGTPSIMDGPPLPAGGALERLRTVGVEAGEHGGVWAHYEVVRA